MEQQRPPLGAMSTDIWVEKRKQDLSRAIHDYVVARISGPLLCWIDELRELVTRYP